MATDGACPTAFETLFTKNVPHLLEMIFMSLDYESFKTCLKVSTKWRALLTSESYLEKAKSLYHGEIVRDEGKLWLAAKQGNIGKVRSLSSSIFVNVNCVKGADRSTPLCEAVESACALSNRARTKASLKKIVLLLLDRGANPNLGDINGWTPLHSTNPRKGNEDIVQLLLERGADPDLAATNSGTGTGTTLLHLAAERGNIDVTQLLLDRGAKHTNTSHYGHTPLHYAAMEGHKDIVRLLLNAGADPNKENDRRETPLLVAQGALNHPYCGIFGSKPAAYMDVVAMLSDAMKEERQ